MSVAVYFIECEKAIVDSLSVVYVGIIVTAITSGIQRMLLHDVFVDLYQQR